MKELRKVLFKEWIAPVYIDIKGGEHSLYGEAYNIKDEDGKTSCKKKEGTQVYSDYRKEGLFHIFSTQGDEESTTPIAVIELEDGTVQLIPADNIKFIN